MNFRTLPRCAAGCYPSRARIFGCLPRNYPEHGSGEMYRAGAERLAVAGWTSNLIRPACGVNPFP